MLRSRLVGAALLAAAALAGCSLVPGSTPEIKIIFENSTPFEVRLRANGVELDPAPAGASGGRVVPATALPVKVEALTPGGRLLGALELEAAPTCTTADDGSQHCTGEVLLRDMQCGRFAMWASEIAPSFPAPLPGQGEPCGP